jgi:hypothetical protein
MAGIYDSQNSLSVGALMGSVRGSRSRSSVGALMGALTQKRKVYFSFHFDDIMRVNNVRQAWKIDHPDAPQMRSFYDSSLWESRRLDSPESVKALIRDGVEHTSAICVLVGTETWSRPWVRYEIARAVIDGRGLLAVHLNNLCHHVTRLHDLLGRNPLEYMAVGKVQPTAWSIPQYYLFEWNGQGWARYQNYTFSVTFPCYLADPAAGYVTQLSGGTSVYDYVKQVGHKNIGAWIDQAAQQAVRLERRRVPREREQGPNPWIPLRPIGAPMQIRGLEPVTAPPPGISGLESPREIGGITSLRRVIPPLPEISGLGSPPDIGGMPGPRRMIAPLPEMPGLESPPNIGGIPGLGRVKRGR